MTRSASCSWFAWRGGSLRLATLALLASCFGLVAHSCKGRPRSSPSSPEQEAPVDAGSHGPGTIVEFDLTAGAPESTWSGSLFGRPASRTFVGLVRSIERAAKNEDATGFFVKIGTSRLGYARSEEVGRLFAELREREQPIVCHADALSNSSAWMALRACDRIWLSPVGEVETVGIAGQVVYFKGALDKLKVRADFLQMGKYKSFAEMLTREGPTDEARESLVGTLGSMRAAWLGDARDVYAPAAKAMERGPWTPAEAKERGLVHDVGYESDALEDAKARGKGERVRSEFGPEAGVGGSFGLAEIIRLLTGADERSGGRPHVAVIVLTGGITMAGSDLFSDDGIQLRAARRTIRRIAEDDSAKAVVLRIDSPGGSALASDLLWHELRQLGMKKKVIASVGEMAASGGYYLAVAAEKIVAERTSIVGSIGVVGGKVVVGEGLAEIGVTSATFPASPEPGAAERAAYLSALTPWDDATRERVRRQMKNVYDVFLDRVAQGRGLELEEVERVAQGRIWSGAQGKDRKLVDELGGLSRAIELAREMAELDDDAPVVVSGLRDSLLESLMLDEGADASAVAEAVRRRQARAPRSFDALVEPMKPFVQAVEPLIGGERVLAAVPYAFVVR